MNKKINALVTFCLLTLASCTTTATENPEYQRPVYIAPGIGLGTIIAVVISWSRNKSILWAIVHGILGWFYVIYAILVKKKD
ncbi:MAG: hypothetical protein ABIT07_11415 [Ferruginibacter sp.]